MLFRSLNISSNLINMPPLLVGITMHFDTNSIADFQPASRMKCHALGNPPHFPNSEFWPNQLMAITGNAMKRLVENVVDSLRRKRLKRHTNSLCPLHQTRKPRTNQRSHSFHANLAPLLKTPIRKHRTWAINSAKTVNSPLKNKPADSQTIFAFFVEV